MKRHHILSETALLAAVLLFLSTGTDLLAGKPSGPFKACPVSAAAEAATTFTREPANLCAASARARKAAPAPVPVTHIMVCCRSNGAGTRFLVNGEWKPDHDYSDIGQVRDIFRKIKDAGINVVSVDFTNPSMWNLGDVPGEPLLWNTFSPMLDNIVQVCREMDMQFFLFLGNPAAWTFKYWNRIAGIVLDRWADLPVYRKYGFGDDRPMLVMFYPGWEFRRLWDQTPDEEKDNLAKFRIGTTQVNDPILPVETDGWGYRNYSSSSDGKVRFVSPNSGVGPDQWERIGAKAWQERMEWVMGATEYAVVGSYDDTCDAIFWGIADCSESTRVKHHANPETVDDPYFYYETVKRTIASCPHRDK